MTTLNDLNGNIGDLNKTITNLREQFRLIFGDDFSAESSSPQEQIINVLAQQQFDLLEKLRDVLSSFDPEQAQGIFLDQRVALNNILRKTGTYTIQLIDITTNRSLTLNGLDTDNPYTVADNNGNKYFLETTQNPTSAGTYSYSFRAEFIGNYFSQQNTITNPVTVVIGVTNINNSNSPISIGTTEETDAELRIRRKLSTSINSSGNINALYSNIINKSNVADVKIYENDTSEIVNTLKPHSIYVVAEGGTDQDIANGIAEKLQPGCNTNGNVSIPFVNSQGIVKYYNFDRPQAKLLYIKFDIKSTKVGQSFNTTAIKNYIITNKIYNIGQDAETSDLIFVAKDGIDNAGGGGVPLNLKISKDNSNWVDYLTVDLLKEKWIIINNNIAINIL